MNLDTFRVRLVPTIFLVIAAAILLSLTYWQISRFFERSALEDVQTERMRAEPVSVKGSAELRSDDIEFRRVIAHGEFQPRTAYVLDPSGGGGRCWLVSPLELADGSVVLVKRGFVPAPRRVSCERGAYPTPRGDTWHALVTRPPGVVDQLARDAAEDRDWAAMDVEGILQAWGIHDAPDVVLLLDERHSGDPLPRADWSQVTNPYLTAFTHLSYAGTWFFVLLICFGFWLVTCFGAFETRSED